MLTALFLSAFPAPQSQGAAQEIFSFAGQGLPAVLVDAKDQGLLELTRLLEPRLLELARELAGETEIPPAAFGLLARVLVGPMRLGISIPAEGAAANSPVYARLEMPEANPEAALELARRMTRLLRQSGLKMELPEAAGLQLIAEAPLPAWVGSEAEQAVLLIGDAGASVGSAVQALSATGAPFAMSLDYGRMLRYMNSMSGAADAEAQMTLNMLGELGLLDMLMQLEMRVREKDTQTLLYQRGYAKALRENGLFPEGGLPASLLQLIPEDAVWAQAGAIDASAYVDLMLDYADESLAAMGISDPMGEVEKATGFHPERDFLDHLGTSFGVYASDTTGGGGLSSMVLFYSLTHPAEMGESIQRLVQTANAMAASQAQGRVAIRSWESAGIQYSTITFPGLPVPLEPTWAIAGNSIFLGATPQATLGAVHQALHAETSLANNSRFLEQLPEQRDGMISVLFLDSPRLLRSGYAPMALLCSALVNATRSPEDPARDAGLVLPPYHELMRGARAAVGLTRLVGDDIVQESLNDRSFAVNMTALAGFLMEGPLLPILGFVGIAAERSMQDMGSEPFPFEVYEEEGDGY